MQVMDIGKLIRDMIEAGETEKSISLMCGVSQPHINRLKKGITLNPSVSVAMSVQSAHKKALKKHRRRLQRQKECCSVE